MRKAGFSLLLLFLATSTLLFAGDKAKKPSQPLNVKTGMWEINLTTNQSGVLPIPPDDLARMSPQQRARFEGALRAQQGSHTRTYKSCVTEEGLKKGLDFTDRRDRECSQKLISSTSTHAEVQLACDIEGVKGHGTLVYDVVDSEHVKGSSKVVVEGDSPMTVNSTATSHWLGSSCTEKD